MWYTNAIRGRICGIDQVPLTFMSLHMDQKVPFAEGGRLWGLSPLCRTSGWKDPLPDNRAVVPVSTYFPLGDISGLSWEQNAYSCARVLSMFSGCGSGIFFLHQNCCRCHCVQS